MSINFSNQSKHIYIALKSQCRNLLMYLKKILCFLQLLMCSFKKPIKKTHYQFQMSYPLSHKIYYYFQARNFVRSKMKFSFWKKVLSINPYLKFISLLLTLDLLFSAEIFSSKSIILVFMFFEQLSFLLFLTLTNLFKSEIFFIYFMF